MALQPEYREAAIQTLPPSYEASDANDINEQRHQPAITRNFYHEDRMPESIQFTFYPNPDKHWRTQEWLATIMIKCDDVPRLMREGFFWNDANVVKEDGFINEDTKNGPIQADKKAWRTTRHYFLQDLHQPRRWTAKIEVFGLRDEALFHFDLRQLRRERIREGYAVNRHGEAIYVYHHGVPQRCFNAIYDDLLMPGQWPRGSWPKPKADAIKDSEVEYLREATRQLDLLS
ncbi:hypothetical protein F4861DRAFT_549840 [Xylaria intraflava]|nr:hypothetical protein F4861DRAFT_549840 [Xylaria intraflava]